MKLLDPLGIDKQSEINPKVRLIDVVSYYKEKIIFKILKIDLLKEAY